MKKVGFFLFLCVCAAVADSTAVNKRFTVTVRPDSSAEPVLVTDVLLQMEFRGAGVYFREDYPTLPAFPMENGEIMRFENISRATCRGERVFWRKFVPSEERSRYTDIDAEGYRRYSDVEVRMKIVDRNGKVTEGLLNRPDYADVFLIGKTDRGDYRLKLDQENGKTVEIIFKSEPFLRCPKDSRHVFLQQDYRFCPYCGAELKNEANP